MNERALFKVEIGRNGTPKMSVSCGRFVHRNISLTLGLVNIPKRDGV